MILKNGQWGGVGSGEGTVLSFTRGDAAALVLFGPVDEAEPLFTSLDLLAAVEEVPTSFRGVAVAGGRLIRTLKRLVHVGPGGGDEVGSGSGSGAGASSASGHRILSGSVSYAALWRLSLRMRAMMVVLRLAEQVGGPSHW